jgi:hypothetical protein
MLNGLFVGDCPGRLSDSELSKIRRAELPAKVLQGANCVKTVLFRAVWPRFERLAIPPGDFVPEALRRSGAPVSAFVWKTWILPPR